MTAITARNTTDLLSLVPYLLGYQPRGVVAVVCSRRTVEVSLRFDYWMFDSPEMVRARLADIVQRFPERSVLLVAYGDDPEAADDALAVLETAVDPRDVLDSVRTDGERWWSRLCVGDCCPVEGNPCDPNSAAAVGAVVAGAVALDSRDELEKLVEGPSLVDQGLLLADLVDADERVRRATSVQCEQRMLTLVGEHLGEPLSDEVAMELGVLAQSIPARDAAWLEMGMATAKEHQTLWQQVVARMPDSHAVPALCLMAAAAWLDGNGALMGCCLARAGELDPSYSMLSVLGDIHDVAAPPSLWNEMQGAG